MGQQPDPNFVVTISHQFGSGGAAVGEELARRFGVPFVDRQILERVAAEYRMDERDMERREERISTFWQRFARAELIASPFVEPTPDTYLTDRDLFEMESDYIERIVRESPAVILGRGAGYILRGRPRAMRILLVAPPEFRAARTARLSHLDAPAAARLIERNDRERAAYLRAFTRRDMYDARQYDLCLDTSLTGVEGAAELLAPLAAKKLGLPLPPEKSRRPDSNAR